MKRKLAFILSVMLTVSFTGCSYSETENQPSEISSTASAEYAETENQSSEISSTASAEYTEKIFSNDILEINITADESEWDYLMENAIDKPWIQCNIDINGETFENVGIKTKGNTSLSQLAQSDSDRYSLKVNFGKYNNEQTCYGLDKLVLNNVYADSTYLKEYMSYNLMQYMNVPSSMCTFASITVNGEYYGFFLAIEDTDDSYLDRIYGENNSVEAYKPESMDMAGENGMMKDMPQMPNDMEDMPQMPDNMEDMPQMPDNMDDMPQMPDDMEDMPQMPDDMDDMPQMPDNMDDMKGMHGGGFGKDMKMDGGKDGVNLVYSDDNSESYSGIFDNAITNIDDEDKARLINSLKNISEGNDIEKYIDVDEVLRYTACNVFLVNLDSYFADNGHNYILTDNNGKLSMLPWDYNLSFGTYRCENSSDAVNYAIDTVFDSISAEERPIIAKLLENEEYFAKYHEYLNQIVTEYMQSGIFEKTIDELSDKIDSYVKADTTSFNGYDTFKEGIEALKLFGKLRTESVSGQLDGSIPSTAEAQAESDKLISSESLDMNKLGTMEMGRREGMKPQKIVEP